MKTPVSYYGGKQSIIRHIMPLLPAHEVYTENFVGGGTVFWAKEPAKNETINDRLDIVINFYRQIKRNFPALKLLIEESLISRSIHTQALRMIKKKTASTEVQLAWAFWYCANFSYANKIGGGYKYSNDMGVIVPCTLTNKKKAFTELLVHRIENVYIENTDDLTVLRSRNVAKAFHYQDPPYVGADQGHYTGYTEDDLRSLLEFNAHECKGKFILSHYNHPLIDQFIKVHGWQKKEITHRLKAPRKSGPEKTEILVWNYNHRQHQYLFSSNLQ